MNNDESCSHEFVSFHNAVDDGEDALTVGFSRDPADEESLDGLILQRGKEKSGAAAGIQGVYVEIPIQRYVTYGGIREALLRRDCFRICFDEAGASEMGNLQEISVRFDLAESEFELIRDGLRRVFVGCTCYAEAV